MQFNSPPPPPPPPPPSQAAYIPSTDEFSAFLQQNPSSSHSIPNGSYAGHQPQFLSSDHAMPAPPPPSQQNPQHPDQQSYATQPQYQSQPSPAPPLPGIHTSQNASTAGAPAAADEAPTELTQQSYESMTPEQQGVYLRQWEQWQQYYSQQDQQHQAAQQMMMQSQQQQHQQQQQIHAQSPQYYQDTAGNYHAYDQSAQQQQQQYGAQQFNGYDQQQQQQQQQHYGQYGFNGDPQFGGYAMQQQNQQAYQYMQPDQGYPVSQQFLDPISGYGMPGAPTPLYPQQEQRVLLTPTPAQQPRTGAAAGPAVADSAAVIAPPKRSTVPVWMRDEMAKKAADLAAAEESKRSNADNAVTAAQASVPAGPRRFREAAPSATTNSNARPAPIGGGSRWATDSRGGGSSSGSSDDGDDSEDEDAIRQEVLTRLIKQNLTQLLLSVTDTVMAEVAREVYANADAATAAASAERNPPSKGTSGNVSQGSKQRPAIVSADLPRSSSNLAPAPPRFSDQTASVVSGSLSSLGGAEGGALLGLGYGSENDSDEDDEESQASKAVDAVKQGTALDTLPAVVSARDVLVSPNGQAVEVSAAGGLREGRPSTVVALAGGIGGNSVGQGSATGKGPVPDAGPATLSGVSLKGSGAATPAVVVQQAEGVQVKSQKPQMMEVSRSDGLALTKGQSVFFLKDGGGRIPAKVVSCQSGSSAYMILAEGRTFPVDVSQLQQRGEETKAAIITALPLRSEQASNTSATAADKSDGSVPVLSKKGSRAEAAAGLPYPTLVHVKQELVAASLADNSVNATPHGPLDPAGSMDLGTRTSTDTRKRSGTADRASKQIEDGKAGEGSRVRSGGGDKVDDQRKRSGKDGADLAKERDGDRDWARRDKDGAADARSGHRDLGGRASKRSRSRTRSRSRDKKDQRRRSLSPSKRRSASPSRRHRRNHSASPSPPRRTGRDSRTTSRRSPSRSRSRGRKSSRRTTHASPVRPRRPVSSRSRSRERTGRVISRSRSRDRSRRAISSRSRSRDRSDRVISRSRSRERVNRDRRRGKEQSASRSRSPAHRGDADKRQGKDSKSVRNGTEGGNSDANNSEDGKHDKASSHEKHSSNTGVKRAAQESTVTVRDDSNTEDIKAAVSGGLEVGGKSAARGGDVGGGPGATAAKGGRRSVLERLGPGPGSVLEPSSTVAAAAVAGSEAKGPPSGTAALTRHESGDSDADRNVDVNDRHDTGNNKSRSQHHSSGGKHSQEDRSDRDRDTHRGGRDSKSERKDGDGRHRSEEPDDSKKKRK